MDKTYHLSLTVGETFTSMPFQSRQDAIDGAVDAFMATYPDEDDVHQMPEPVEEDELRMFIRSHGLEEEFSFQITESDEPPQA